MTVRRLPVAMMFESRSCSETIGAASLRAAVPGGGISIATVLVTGG
jgi:hypothetical protein